MANTVRIPYSNTSGNVPSTLSNGVLGINQASGALYYRNSSGVVTLFSPEVTLADGYVYDCGEYVVTLPGTPTSLSVTAGAAQASLSWTAPSSNGGATITDYSIQYSTNAGSNWTSFSHNASSATTATVTGLATGTYLFRVAAINSGGTGNYVTSGSVSISATNQKIAISRDNGSTSSFSGNGTSATPYARAAAFYWDDANGMSHYAFTLTAAGTVFISFNCGDETDSNQTFTVRKNGSTVATSSGGGGTLTYSGAGTTNDAYTIVASNVGSQAIDTVSVYAT